MRGNANPYKSLKEIFAEIAPQIPAPIVVSPEPEGFCRLSGDSSLLVPNDMAPTSGVMVSMRPALSFSRMAFVMGVDLAEPPKTKTVDEQKFAALKEAQPRTASKRVPDAVEVLTAWRAWGISANSRGELRLQSLGKDQIWKPKKMIVGLCNSDHPAPNWECKCGIWSFKSADHLLSAIQGTYSPKVIGQVSLWGRVIECENGFRAQYAYPKELWLLDNSLEELGYIYGVPVRTV